MRVGFGTLAGALWWSKTVGTAWNKLQDVLVEVLTQLGVRGSLQFLVQEPPKRAKTVQKWPKSDFEHSAGGPKRLEWRGAKLEQVTGASRNFENLDIIFENLDIIFENGI